MFSLTHLSAAGIHKQAVDLNWALSQAEQDLGNSQVKHKTKLETYSLPES